MSIPKWKRRESELDYVDNSYTLQGDIMNLASKFSARWARIYQLLIALPVYSLI